MMAVSALLGHISLTDIHLRTDVVCVHLAFSLISVNVVSAYFKRQ